MSEEQKKDDDSMEDILASIRETVEEEVDKAAEDGDTGTDDLANELLAEEISDDEPADTEVNDNDIADAGDALNAMAEVKAEMDAEKEETVDSEDLLGEIGDADIPNEQAEDSEIPEEEEIDVDALMAETSDAEDAEKAEESSDDEEVDVDALMAESSDDEAAEEAPAEEKPAEEPVATTDEDVLELTDVVEDATSDDDMIDVDKFAESGEVAPADEADVKASREEYAEETPADGENADDIDADSLMSELEDEGELPDGTEALPEEGDAASFIAQNNIEEGEEPAADEMVEPSVAESVASEAAESISQKVFLPTSPSAKGLQVSFPAEVLAEALRPLVTGWIEENLANIVERLVKEELSKLADK